MTVSGIVSALIVGVAAGLLGHMVIPNRRGIPIWLTCAVGVAAALLGTICASLMRVNGSGLGVRAVAIQIVLAVSGIAAVAGTARSRRQNGLHERTHDYPLG